MPDTDVSCQASDSCSRATARTPRISVVRSATAWLSDQAMQSSGQGDRSGLARHSDDFYLVEARIADGERTLVLAGTNWPPRRPSYSRCGALSAVARRNGPVREGFSSERTRGSCRAAQTVVGVA